MEYSPEEGHHLLSHPELASLVPEQLPLNPHHKRLNPPTRIGAQTYRDKFMVQCWLGTRMLIK